MPKPVERRTRNAGVLEDNFEIVSLAIEPGNI
jgi:hypothetical protein